MTTDTIIEVPPDKKIELPPEIQNQLIPGQQYRVCVSF